ncbi:MAG: HAD family hydrolase [Methylococcales bacterium]|nr:HAD family hydrolase [Methylococcales bacterium]
MSLAIFDLDNTLISNDSDYLWGQFLVDQGIVNKVFYEDMNAKFYVDYQQGCLDIDKFLQFSLRPLSQHPVTQLFAWRQQFIDEVIQPFLLDKAQALVNKHRQQGDTLLVITATNRFITEPIVNLYGIKHLLATTPELKNGAYTGKVEGIPCFQSGKVTLLEQWLKTSSETLVDSYFYSDSHNDLPLLKQVDHPVAVDPDEKLQAAAVESNWPIISLRD